MVTRRGIDGRVAALNKFISQSSNRCKLFYDILRKNKGFEWTSRHEAVLDDLKTYLTTPPLLSKPSQGEDLYVYLSTTDHALSVVLVKEHEGVQSPIYYVSKSLVDAEIRYTSLEKLVLALAMTFTKLRHYFESHQTYVLTNFPLRAVLSKPKLTGRMAKWAIQLSIYDIVYDTRTVIKSQALAEFVANFSLGLVLKSPQGDIIAFSICCDFKSTNNEAEYEVLNLGLTTSNDMKVLREGNVQADALAGLGAVFKGLNLNNIPVLHIMRHAVKRLAHEVDVLVLKPQDNNGDEVMDNWIQDYLADMVLRDAHEEECGNHTNGRNLSLKILPLGYYRPTLRQDALEYMKKYDACQRHAPVIHQPSEHLNMWLFMK
ncbi:uncharacterized protein LOC141664582 [Apium graveolens]|uniref:uncharacterized protein LOC141664582 n=1 Tax=Apium graveolens TaxID=4045 RepID=UPI003D7B6E95